MREEIIMLTAAKLDVDNVNPIPQPPPVYAWKPQPPGSRRSRPRTPENADKIQYFKPTRHNSARKLSMAQLGNAVPAATCNSPTTHLLSKIVDE